MREKLLFINRVVKKSLNTFEYYRRGPVSLKGLSPGKLFQECVNLALLDLNVPFKEAGLADHALPTMGMSIQLKTTSLDYHDDNIVFCRSSVSHIDKTEQKLARLRDVRRRVLDLADEFDTKDFLLVYVDLHLSHTRVFQLWNESKGFVGDWILPENVSSSPNNTHVKVRLRNMKEITL